MSTRSSLSAAPRTLSNSGANKRLRRDGLVPAIVYGRKFENKTVQVNAKALRDLLAHSTSENILVNLDLGSGSGQLALIQDVTHDPLTGGIVHVDFHAVKEDEKIHARIPVELHGESPGVKLGGLLDFLVHSLEVECLPKDLPDKIVVDINGLEIGALIHVRDLALPEGVSTKLGGDVIVLHIVAPRVSAEEPAKEAKAKDAKGGKGKK